MGLLLHVRHCSASLPACADPLCLCPALGIVQGKPAKLEAFPRAVALDYARRGGGQALTDEELGAAAALLCSRLQHLDLGGAFQLSTEGVQGALRACTALRSLAADGSTLQDAAFAGLAAPQAAAAPSGSDAGGSSGAEAGSSGSGSKGPAAMLVCGAGAASCGSPMAWTPRSRPAAPLQRLERLSLRGCMFLRGGLLADLAAACPELSSLALAGCSLALK